MACPAGIGLSPPSEAVHHTPGGAHFPLSGQTLNREAARLGVSPDEASLEALRGKSRRLTKQVSMPDEASLVTLRSKSRRRPVRRSALSTVRGLFPAPFQEPLPLSAARSRARHSVRTAASRRTPRPVGSRPGRAP